MFTLELSFHCGFHNSNFCCDGLFHVLHFAIDTLDLFVRVGEAVVSGPLPQANVGSPGFELAGQAVAKTLDIVSAPLGASVILGQLSTLIGHHLDKKLGT